MKPSVMRVFLNPGATLCLSVLALLATFSCGQATTTVTATASTTPAPSAGVVFPLVMSFLIDGVVYIMNCNVTGLNMSSCSYTQDHGLTVSRIGSTKADLPDYFMPVTIITLAVVGILMIMAIAGWIVYGQRKTEYASVPSAMPPNYGDPQQFNQQPPGYPDPYRPSARQDASRRVISVCLVKPGVPIEQGGMA